MSRLVPLGHGVKAGVRCVGIAPEEIGHALLCQRAMSVADWSSLLCWVGREIRLNGSRFEFHILD
ncbi:MAG: hypothetical protein ACYCWN_05655 [Ferrimicrobium sp.]|uniref:hypothetical protein n=1 Tax=Ferrimicrobium TaxID=121038 RepID=UPI0026107B9F|nr:hypothetical protein [Ferrimicrobium sp.]